MADSFLIRTNEIPLFNTGKYKNGKFYCEAKLSYTIDRSTRTYTITVEGVKGYCYYRWNFAQNISMKLSSYANYSSSSTKEFKFPAPGKVSNGAINGKPYIPDDYGYPLSVTKLVKTFNYNLDGTPALAYFYLQDYNTQVQNVVDGKWGYVNVIANTLISDKIPNIEPADLTLAELKEKDYKEEGNYVSFTLESTADISKWQCKINGKDMSSYGTGGSRKYMFGAWVNANTTGNIIVTATKKSNKKTTTWEKTYDVRIPNITAKVDISEINKGIVTIGSTYDVEYKIQVNNSYPLSTSPSNSYAKNWQVEVSLTPDAENNIKVEIFRKNNILLKNETLLKVDNTYADFTCSVDNKIINNNLAKLRISNKMKKTDLYYYIYLNGENILTEDKKPIAPGKYKDLEIKVISNSLSNMSVWGYKRNIISPHIEIPLTIDTRQPSLTFFDEISTVKSPDQITINNNNYRVEIDSEANPSYHIDIYDEKTSELKANITTNGEASFSQQKNTIKKYKLKVISNKNNCYKNYTYAFNTKYIHIDNLDIQSYNGEAIISFIGKIQSTPLNDGYFKYELELLDEYNKIIANKKIEAEKEKLDETYFKAGTKIIDRISIPKQYIGTNVRCKVKAYVVSNLDDRQGTRVNHITTATTTDYALAYPSIKIFVKDAYNNIVDKNAVAYIYKNKKWNVAIPYVYNENKWKN